MYLYEHNYICIYVSTLSTNDPVVCLSIYLEECFKRWGVIEVLDLRAIKNMLKDVKGCKGPNSQGPFCLSQNWGKSMDIPKVWWFHTSPIDLCLEPIPSMPSF